MESLKPTREKEHQDARRLVTLNYEGMRDASRQEYERARSHLKITFAYDVPSPSLDHVHRLVFTTVNVQGRREAGRDQGFDQPKGSTGRLSRRQHGHPRIQEPNGFGFIAAS